MRNIFFTLSIIVITGLAGLVAQDGITGVPGTAKLVNQVNLSQLEDDMFPIMRNVSKAHFPGTNEGKDAFIAEKKRINEAFLDMVRNETPSPSPRSAAVTPTQGINFKANPFGGGWPNDNDLAVNNQYIVSTTNSLVRVYDHNGRQLLGRTLEQLGGTADTIGGAFDPRALYDKDNDRWIVMYINGSSVTPGIDEGYNNLVVAFSQSNDPTQGWNVYAFDGNLETNPNANQLWMDYPQGAITQDELFVTGNMFRLIPDPNDPNNPINRADGAAVWQINLSDGYSGNSSIAFEVYRDNNAFSLSPVEGEPDILGPEMYFLSKGSSSGRSMLVYSIDGTMNNPSTVYKRETSLTLRTTFGTPPGARQPNSNNDVNRLLSTNDGRVLHALRVNNNLYGVFASAVSGRPGIYLVRVDISSPLGANFWGHESTLISSADVDLGFPSISFAGQSCDLGGGKSNDDLFIGFNYASPTKFPGNGMYYVNIRGEVSEPILLIEGLGNLDLTGLSDNSRNRWGDYSDVATRGNLWEGFIAGYYSERNGDHTTWISQVEVNPAQENWCLAVSIDDKEEIAAQELTAYPNPVMDYLTFEFVVEQTDMYRAYIMDMQGRYVKHIKTDVLVPGTVKMGFNAAALPAGQYQVIVDSRDSKRLLTKKITVVK